MEYVVNFIGVIGDLIIEADNEHLARAIARQRLIELINEADEKDFDITEAD